MLGSWKNTTIRARPNTIYQFEKDGHRIGWDKRVNADGTITQYRPRCFGTNGCRWKSPTWFKARNEAARREFIRHYGESVSTQESLPGVTV